MQCPDTWNGFGRRRVESRPWQQQALGRIQQQHDEAISSERAGWKRSSHHRGAGKRNDMGVARKPGAAMGTVVGPGDARRGRSRQSVRGLCEKRRWSHHQKRRARWTAWLKAGSRLPARRSGSILLSQAAGARGCLPLARRRPWAISGGAPPLRLRAPAKA